MSTLSANPLTVLTPITAPVVLPSASVKYETELAVLNLSEEAALLRDRFKDHIDKPAAETV